MNRRAAVLISIIAVGILLLPCIASGCEDLQTTHVSGSLSEVSYLDSQPVDLATIANLDLADLSDTEKQVLARQSFVAVDLPAGGGFWKFWHVYETARYQGLPAFITTDSLLNAYHGLFDTLLQRMEEAALLGQAVTMTQDLYGRAYDQWAIAADPTIKAEARENRIYFAVGAALLDPPASIPADLRNEVQAEVALIEAAAGPTESPTFGYVEDYSQYKPRGHYSRSEALERYFRAMMWYGHTGFFINPRNPDISEDEAVSLTRRAILICSSLVDSAREAWAAIYEPTSFLVGPADDLTVDDMEQVLAQVFGTTRPEPDALGDAGKIADVRRALNELPAPKILTAPVPQQGDGTSDAPSREEAERSFRLMGQRYIPDSYAFQQLVWAYVGTEDNMRTLPMGLDIMTVLGSDVAYQIETQDYRQHEFANWEGQVAKIRQEFTGRSPDVWPAGLYTSWLDSLQQVMTLPTQDAPAFMRSRAWALKSLNTALGSWTELRHDTILYAKQSVIAEGEGGEEPESTGYVEPYPAFYAKIAELAGALQQILTDYDLLDPDSADKLQTMIWIATTLESAAQKELAGETLADAEISLILEYGHYLENLEEFGATEEGLTLSPASERSPIVADVHTDYVTSPNIVLEEATGYPLSLYVAFEVEGEVRLFLGASYSYYEFTSPIAERFTDDEWIARLDTGDVPPRPAWTDEWIVQR